MRVRWVGTILKHVLGVLCWFAVFAFLQFECLFNVGSAVDGLWVKDLHDDLVENLIGEVAYRAERGHGDSGCGARYIYSVRYHPNREDSPLSVGGELRSLTSLVDLATWRFVGQESAIATYVDSKHEYSVRTISDGTEVWAVDR